MAITRMTMAEVLRHKSQADWAKVDATTEEDIIRHMIEDGEIEEGEDPYDDARYQNMYVVYPPKHLRKKLKMTQQEFADALYIPLKTLRNWEQHRTMPDPAARALLRLVAKDPQWVINALKPIGSQS